MTEKEVLTKEKTISAAVSARLNFFRVTAAWLVLVGHGFSFNKIIITNLRRGFHTFKI